MHDFAVFFKPPNLRQISARKKAVALQIFCNSNGVFACMVRVVII